MRSPYAFMHSIENILYSICIFYHMSKPKPKDKKPDNYQQLQKQFQDQKRDLIDANFTIKKLQERINLLTHQNHRLEEQRQNQFTLLNEKIEELSIKNETNEKRLIMMRNDLTTSEVENKKLSNAMNLLQKNMNDQRTQKVKEHEEMRKNFTFEIAKYENMLNDYKLYMSERDTRQKEINQLIEAREIQVANRIREVADKEREKVQATDKIRDQMGNKIRQMRQNLLSLKKEELETTTRLTMLQNHQLTTELEYQSKQTEKIVFKNEDLEKTITKLRQELEIHKQVEDQLAKRSHFSKGIIKKLHARVEELEGELNRSKDQSNSLSGQDSLMSKRQSVQRPEKAMAQAIDKQLQRSQKKNAQLQSRYELLQRQKEEIALKLESSQRIKNQLYNSLLQCFTGLFDEEQKESSPIRLGLSEVRRKSPKDWTKEQTNGVLEILLVSCQSYLSKANLNTPALRKIVLLGDNQREAKLPRIASDREKKPFTSASENKLEIEDICNLAKKELSKQKYSINIASKMVTSKLREWGKPLSCKSRGTLSKKYQLSSSYRT